MTSKAYALLVTIEVGALALIASFYVLMIWLAD
jgi:hypothetical protein